MRMIDMKVSFQNTDCCKRDKSEAMSLWHKAELCQDLQASFHTGSSVFIVKHPRYAHGHFFLSRVK